LGTGTPFDLGAALANGTLNSGYNNVGNFVSGYGNTLAAGTPFYEIAQPGPTPPPPYTDFVSGVSNTALGGTFFNGRVSGFFNTGVPTSLVNFPSGTASGLLSGVGNTGTLTFGWLNAVSTLQSLL
jgi:hypothetical protein